MKNTTQQGQKFRWELTAADDAAVTKIMSSCSLSFPVARTLVSRGFSSPPQVFEFLSIARDRVADSKLLKGAEAAVKRLLKAIKNKEKILIFGDYDVDGITSTAIMLISLLPLGADINFFLPNRRRDGYGLSSKIVHKAASSGYKLIVTVDNGISAYQAVSDAKAYGMDVIITDHHRPHSALPKADVIVNPQQKDCTYPYKEFAGAGVIFKVMELLYRQLGKELPAKAYELLMLGTIADVVPLINENRYWVHYGLQQSNAELSTAMKVLAANGKVLEKQAISARDIGFMIAPQLNALGRLDDPREGVTFMISSDREEVARIGRQLLAINEERKRVDRSIYDEIEAAITAKQIDLDKENLIMASHKEWPARVIGLVAGKLMQNYGRPTILFQETDKGIVKGSCRSIPAFNIFDALAENKELLMTFGGHSCAAGLSLKAENVPELKKRIEAKIAKELRPDDLIQKLKLEAQITLPDVARGLVSDMHKMEPFGAGNQEPLFWLQGVQLVNQPKLLKDKHLKCTVFADGVIKPLMFFNRPELFPLFSQLGDASFDVAVKVVENEWRQKISIELQGLDVALPVVGESG